MGNIEIGDFSVGMVIVKMFLEVFFFIQCYVGEIIVIKYGGYVMGDDDFVKGFVCDIVLIK